MGQPDGSGGVRRPGRVDLAAWRDGQVEGRPVRQALAERDVGAALRFLLGLGWSRMALSAATGWSETRVRAVIQGKQRIHIYEVLERVATGLWIPRGAMGLAYTDDLDQDPGGQ